VKKSSSRRQGTPDCLILSLYHAFHLFGPFTNYSSPLDLSPTYLYYLFVMAAIGQLLISPPLINTSCAWAGERHELDGLFASPHTGAVTVRTATANGFKEDETHTVHISIPAGNWDRPVILRLTRSSSPPVLHPPSTRTVTARTPCPPTSFGLRTSSIPTRTLPKLL
jgi:hypothetical protein